MKYLIKSSLLLLLTLFLMPDTTLAQEEEKPRKWALNGYVKDLVTANFVRDSVLLDNLIHNRLNFSWNPTGSLKFQLGVRNRVFFGKTVNLIPNYSELISANYENEDLAFFPVKRPKLLWYSELDRAFLQWTKNNWELTVGRQRINWSVNLVWNPNDFFNTYNFFDFDYEERRGSDAVRVVKYLNYTSSFEVTATYHPNFHETVSAMMYKWNMKGYDLQILGGKVRRDLAVGTGWAGNLGQAGFKGEVTYLHPYIGEMKPTMLASLASDYSFRNGLYLHGSVLYNSSGKLNPDLLVFDPISNQPPTLRTLSTNVFSTFVQVVKPVNPIFNTSLSMIYYPSTNGIFVNPALTFSATKNIDLDLIGQLYWDKFTGEYRSLARIAYFRFKYSF
jgi:hypothetical protein